MRGYIEIETFIYLCIFSLSLGVIWKKGGGGGGGEGRRGILFKIFVKWMRKEISTHRSRQIDDLILFLEWRNIYFETKSKYKLISFLHFSRNYLVWKWNRNWSKLNCIVHPLINIDRISLHEYFFNSRQFSRHRLIKNSRNFVVRKTF